MVVPTSTVPSAALRHINNHKVRDNTININNNLSNKERLLTPTRTTLFDRATTTPTGSRGSAQPVLHSVAHGNRQLLANQHNSTRFPYSFYSPPATIFHSNTNPTSQCRTTTTYPSINSRITSAKSHSTSDSLFTRFLQLNLCDSQKEQRFPPGVQFKSFKPVSRSSQVQNGNTESGISSYPKERFSNIHRSTFSLSPHPCTSSVPKVSTFLMEQPNVRIHHNSFRTEPSTMSFYQDFETGLGMGTQPRDQSQCISRRLDLHRQFTATSSASHTDDLGQTAIIGMDHQFREISTQTVPTTGTLGIQDRHYHHGSTTADQKDSRSEEIVTPNIETTVPDSSGNTQSNNEITGSNFCDLSSSTVHSISSATQESTFTPNERLGRPSSSSSSMRRRDQNVDPTTTTVERQIFSSSNPTANTDSGRVGHGMGLSLDGSDDTWLLERDGGTTVNQLEGTSSSLSRDPIIQDSECQLNDTDRQHHLAELHQQTGRNQVAIADEVSHRIVEPLPPEQYSGNSSTYQGDRQHNCRHGVPQDVLQESVASSTVHISSYSSALREKRRGSICRSDNSTTGEICVLEARPNCRKRRRIQPDVDSVQSPVDQSTLEFNHEDVTQDYSRASSASHLGGATLDSQYLLSSTTDDENAGTDFTRPPSHSDDQSNDSSPLTAQQLETIRVAALNNKFGDQFLTPSTQALISRDLVIDNSTNQSYKTAQLAFVKWCYAHSVDLNHFTPEQLVNFLSDVSQKKHYHVNTIKLWRSAITRFHSAPLSLSGSACINALISTLANTEPPRNIHRPTVDLTPTFKYLMEIPSSSSVPLASLQPKLAFLLGLSGFMRPSDLARISLLSASVDSNSQCLTFNVIAPKERRGGVRIIKPFLFHSHQDSRLCPVQCFQAVKHHPRAQTRPADTLFVQSTHPSKAVLTATISSWLRRLIRRSTSEPRTSVCSLGSSRALREGISLDDIITLGNWRSADTFQTYYRREHLAEVDFTNQIVNLKNPRVDVQEIHENSDEDLFLDAVSDIEDVSSLKQH